VLRWLFAVIGSMCLLFAFSRLLFGIVAIGLAVGFMFRLNWSGKVIVALVIGLAITASLPWLQGAIEQRFSSVHAAQSDEVRGAQIIALVEEWSRSPLIGNGFGTYAHSLVRDSVALYSYEVQWVGFLAKLGLLGIGVLAAMVVMLFRAVMAGGLSIERCMLGMILAAFVLGGFTNQYLVSSASGIVYSLMLVVAGMLPQRRPFEQEAHAWSARHAHP
jgi:hypothetical protein